MSVVIAGIDEAGYGPMLGPLCVGMAVFRLSNLGDEAKVPNLWELLANGVCREPGRGGAHDGHGRVAVADSKKLKLSNSVTTTHPLVHLERGVLAFARCLDGSSEGPADDASLVGLLGSRFSGHCCYESEPRPLPLGLSTGQVLIAANVLRAALSQAGVTLLDLRCELMNESDFNRSVRDERSKAEANAAAFGRHIRYVWERWSGGGAGERVGVVCDRLGGRGAYGGFLSRALAGSEIEVVEESERRSRYVAKGRGPDGSERRAGLAFLVEGESAHLPVALASMVAKYVRELAMLRFNAHWCQVYRDMLGLELKPTAGYRQDGQRWLDEASQVITEDDRRQIVRIA